MSEEIALKMGWVPKDEWKGDPEQWRDAEEYVERGENILPIVKDRLAKTQDKVDELERQLKATTKSVEVSVKAAKKQAEKEYEEKLAELTKKGFEAAQEGDFDTWTEVEKEKNNLEKPEEPEEPSTVFDEWKKENEWYEKDDTATALAMGYAAKLDKSVKDGTTPALSEAEFYNKVADFVKSELPHKFENPNRNQAPIAEGTGHKASKGAKTWSDLPASAKAACKRTEDEFARKGFPFDKEAWIHTYFEEE